MTLKVINKKINKIKKLTIFLFLLMLIKLTDIQIIKREFYLQKYKETFKYVYVENERGKIYDRNGVLLVDNKATRIVKYSSIGVSKKDEIKSIEALSRILNMSQSEIRNIIKKGYYYDIKVIKENISSDEYATLFALNLKGVILDIKWERIYKSDYFKSLLGQVGKISVEKKEYYLNKGYNLNDTVGISFIEEAYEDILREIKNKYYLKNDKYVLLESGRKGNDIYLTIDIKLQEKVEKILEEEIKKAKKEKNTEYYDHSFVIVSNPENGEILAMAGKKISNNTFIDITPEILTTTIQGGSAVKGASNIVGYETGALKIGEKRSDYCIKLKNLEAKCSYKNLGVLDDLTALKYSSNSYQYQTAIKLGEGNYKYNKNLKLKDNTLEIYRKIFNEFGLGVKTEIDLLESSGFVGNQNKPELILDFSVGQYDTYTPIQFNQYINTIANGGNRLKPQLLKGYYINNNFIGNKKVLLNKVEVKDEYLARIQKGFRMVMEKGGTGYYFVPSIYKAAGKTGTSTSYLDSNNDGIVETPTTSNIFVGYAPYDNPVVSFTVISPNVNLAYGTSSYRTSVNKKISYEVARIFFEIFK